MPYEYDDEGGEFWVDDPVQSNHKCPVCEDMLYFKSQWYNDETEIIGNEELFYHKSPLIEERCAALRKMGGWEHIHASDLLDWAEDPRYMPPRMSV